MKVRGGQKGAVPLIIDVGTNKTGDRIPVEARFPVPVHKGPGTK
jgi:hypothetical protein